LRIVSGRRVPFRIAAPTAALMIAGVMALANAWEGTPDLAHAQWTAITAESTAWMPLERGLSYDRAAIRRRATIPAYRFPAYRFVLRAPVRDAAHPAERYAVYDRDVDCGRALTALKRVWYTDSAGRILRTVSFIGGVRQVAPAEADARAPLLYCPIIDSVRAAHHGSVP